GAQLTMSIADTLHGLSVVERARGNVAGLLASSIEALDIYVELSDLSGLVRALEGVAGASILRGDDAQRGVLLLGAAAALRERIGVPVAAADRPAYESDVAAVRACLDASAFAAAWAAGLTTSTEAAVACARELAERAVEARAGNVRDKLTLMATEAAI